MQTIEITGATGTGPYDVYLCDITLTYCFLISGSTTIPPTVLIELPKTFANPFPPPSTNLIFSETQDLIIKLVDLSSGCETFIPYYCYSPTPSPTMTPTPTPTPTSNCRCISVSANTIDGGNFTYTDCSGDPGKNSVPWGTTVYVCGSNPVAVYNCTITIGVECVSGSCPEI